MTAPHKPKIVGQDGNNFRCPICKKVLPGSQDKNFPFCSDRCKLLDLNAWMDGSYFTSRPVDPSDEIETMPRKEDGKR